MFDYLLLAVGYILFAAGVIVSLTNFYLSLVRYPFHYWFGWGWRYVSGIPLVGSLALVLAAMLLRESHVWLWLSLGIALFDTGGLHWFLGTMFWYGVLRRDRPDKH